MKKIVLLFAIVSSIPALSEEIGTYYGRTLIRPFGYLYPRRPPAGVRTVSLDDLRIEFTAKQVCGYTDWSTAVISLPKKILSAEYWKDVGQDIKNKAINSVLAISGALPSMLACNASPTFCAILNRAEALAQANLKFTFDSCQMLEGLSDVTKSQFESLRGCVKNQVNQKGKDSSAALDSCTVGNRDPSSVKSKDKIKKSESEAGDNYKSENLTNRLCKEHSHDRYPSSSHAYSVSEYSCKWLKEFFPGISLEAGAKFKHGGTFSLSPAEDAYDEHIDKTTHYIVDLLDLMHSIRFGVGDFSSSGPMPRHLVVNHPKVRRFIGLRDDGKINGVCYPEDGERCKADITKLPPIYKLSTGTSLPSLMIATETLYEIVELIPRDTTPSKEYRKEGSRVALAVEPLIQSVSYTRAQDLVKDSITRVKKSCRDPDLQSPSAQEDCNSRLGALDQSKVNLDSRMQSDRNHILAQAEYYREVEKMKAEKIRVRGEKSGSVDPVIAPNLTR